MAPVYTFLCFCEEDVSKYQKQFMMGQTNENSILIYYNNIICCDGKNKNLKLLEESNL